MNKLCFALFGATLFLVGCASSQPTKMVAKGPLICAENEVCPELAVKWDKDNRDGFTISAEISNSESFDIKQLVFLVDHQPYAYSTIQPTQYQDQKGLKVSSNFIKVPVSFLNSFRDAKSIDLKLITDKGEIERPILKENGEKSSAYLTFLKGYAEKPE